MGRRFETCDSKQLHHPTPTVDQVVHKDASWNLQARFNTDHQDVENQQISPPAYIFKRQSNYNKENSVSSISNYDEHLQLLCSFGSKYKVVIRVPQNCRKTQSIKYGKYGCTNSSHQEESNSRNNWQRMEHHVSDQSKSCSTNLKIE